MRCRAPDGFEHHGVLNVLAATALAAAGAPPADVAAVLGEPDHEVVVGELAGLQADEVARVRSLFRSFGCCGVTDPLDDIAALGLLETA
jgi:hypothetical protein